MRNTKFLRLLVETPKSRDVALLAFSQAALEYPDAGVFGAKIYLFRDPKRIWCAGRRWSPMGAIFEHLGNGLLDNGEDFLGICDTDYACGCAMVLRASPIRTIGFLDERFFLLFEETNWRFWGESGRVSMPVHACSEGMASGLLFVWRHEVQALRILLPGKSASVG